MLIAVITVLVLGPKELPRVLRTVTRMVRKLRNLSAEFQSTMNDLAREADLDDMKKNFADIEHRVADMRVEDELNSTLDGDNKIAGMFTGDVIGTELSADARQKQRDQDDPLDDAASEPAPQKITAEPDAEPEPDTADSKRPAAVTQTEESEGSNQSDDHKPEDGGEKPIAKVAAPHSASG